MKPRYTMITSDSIHIYVWTYPQPQKLARDADFG